MSGIKLRRVRAVARKEFLHVLRDPRSLIMGLAIPMLLLFMFGYALTLDVDRVPLVVWDQSATPASRDFVKRFTGSRYFALAGTTDNYRVIERAIDERVALMALVVPSGFARDLQAKDIQWTRAKGFDTFCPIGPCIETELDPSDLALETCLNGITKQQTRTSLLIYPVYELVSFISRVMTLLPGDVIATGTTSGIGPMQPGDTVEVKIEGIGTLRNYITRPESA